MSHLPRADSLSAEFDPFLLKSERMGLTSAQSQPIFPTLLDASELHDVSGEIHLYKDKPSAVICLRGVIYRYRLLSNGRQNITSILLPGDVCDMLPGQNVAHPEQFLAAIGTARIAKIPRDRLTLSVEKEPATMQILLAFLLQELAISKEWLTNVTRREAYERIAHFFCELYFRYAAVGRVTQNRFPLAFTQAKISDALGLSIVHFNKTLRTLRDQEYLSIEDRVVTVPSLDRLISVADFNPCYLHFDNPSSFLEGASAVPRSLRR